jgi:hypothetical protein
MCLLPETHSMISAALTVRNHRSRPQAEGEKPHSAVRKNFPHYNQGEAMRCRNATFRGNVSSGVV